MNDCCAEPALLPIEAALNKLLALAASAPSLALESVALADADGRVLAEPLIASLDLPPWDNSAMDGYALCLADWQGEPLLVSQRIFAGAVPQALTARHLCANLHRRAYSGRCRLRRDAGKRRGAGRWSGALYPAI